MEVQNLDRVERKRDILEPSCKPLGTDDFTVEHPQICGDKRRLRHISCDASIITVSLYRFTGWKTWQLSWEMLQFNNVLVPYATSPWLHLITGDSFLSRDWQVTLMSTHLDICNATVWRHWTSQEPRDLILFPVKLYFLRHYQRFCPPQTDQISSQRHSIDSV